ncbi:MAG: type II secretion system protein [Bacilli bacterium]|nr:type II secretion system protein [Bacilli bacterium]
MNKNGFTLIELIAVLVLIILVTLITFPNIRNLMNNNNEKEFTTYQDMMIQYAKTMPTNKYTSNYICLSNLGMDKINDAMVCNGYVTKSGNTYTPYLYCTQNGEQLYKTSGYVNKGCSDV